MLTEDFVRRYLAGIVADLEAAMLNQADMKLSALALERLADAASLGLPEASVAFGRARVFETGEHVAACEDAVRRRNAAAALMNAQRALARWTQPK
jgi:hypothetical protein